MKSIATDPAPIPKYKVTTTTDKQTPSINQNKLVRKRRKTLIKTRKP